MKNPAEPPKAPADGKAAGPTSPVKPGEEKKPAAEGSTPTPPNVEDEIPKNFTLPITKVGQSEIITTLKVSEIFKFEGHPFNVKEDQDMWDLVESVKQLAQQTGESRANIQKITRLTKLEPELQKMVEEKVLPVHTAADISYLKKDEQKKLADAIEKEGGTVPSGSQAALKKESQSGNLTPEKIEKTVAPTKREVDPPLKVTFSDEELRRYFTGERVTVPEVKRTVFEALDLRERALARQAAKEGKEVKDKKPGLAR